VHRVSRLILQLVFELGECWDCGISTDWAGKAVEAVSGRKLDA